MRSGFPVTKHTTRSTSRTRPPVGEEGEEVGRADVVVAVERSKNPRPVKVEGVVVAMRRRGPVIGAAE